MQIEITRIRKQSTENLVGRFALKNKGFDGRMITDTNWDLFNRGRL